MYFQKYILTKILFILKGPFRNIKPTENKQETEKKKEKKQKKRKQEGKTQKGKKQKGRKERKTERIK